MSISHAMQNAMSGLRAASLRSELVSLNIANASTPGYGQRILEVSSLTHARTGGVSVTGIVRLADPAVIAQRREAQSLFAGNEQMLASASGIEAAFGIPGEPGSLAARFAEFEASLIAAASTPSSPQRLDQAVQGARQIALAISDAAERLTGLRSNADAAIANDVGRLNTALVAVQDLNIAIADANINGSDASALMDMRQTRIDEINEIMPVREVARDNGQIALFSDGGIILLDGSAQEVGFDPVRIATPYLSVGAGTLSGLTVAGRPVDTSSSVGKLGNGTLAAHFATRDETIPAAMADLDALAASLVQRFSEPSADPTLVPGVPGLFTDEGAAFDPANLTGMASRLTLSAAVDPAQGGETWRIRDGLGAVAPGSAGQAAGINRLVDTMSATSIPPGGGFGTAPLGLSDMAAMLSSGAGAARLAAENNLTYARGRFDTAMQAELARGVDTDAELQHLMVIEAAYAANARVVETANQMLDTLVRLGS